ncbi:unnamed protein product [Miscanthus lutarioriparius]|uniref:NPR1/NIM1-like C-terminal domain-containing protein n=1 Tax=Miscanthus lutarioriparius TaxID=422564 RepID=A0A811N1C5_9POAL|nr:unnamed protein product [Miscanthus lutarioriparius]
MVPGGRHIGRDSLVAVLGYLYTGRLKVPPDQKCVDDTCRHEACRPAIDFVVESTYAASGFEIPALVSLLQRRLSGIVDIAFYEDIMPIIRVASKCQLSHLLNQCIRTVAFSTLDDNFLEKELAGDIYNDIKKFRRCLTIDELDASIVDAEHEKRVTDIHKALDSGNVDLVSMLLKQYGVTLDEALAIHYAATYCEPKVLQELLKLDHAYVNMKNSGGYTPLHMACMRLEPDIIVSLLEKGASVVEWTQDGRDALTICKRLTRHQKDVNRELKKGKEISKPYLCINILEETKRTFTLDQVSLEEAIVRVTPLRPDNFLMRLLDLECRVTFAKLFFPSVAQLFMRIAGAEFAGSKLKDVGLNESLDWRFRERFDALTRIVELGRRYFPSCSDVLDKFLTEESALALLGNSTPEEDQVRMHFYELRNEVRKAFDKDTASEVINPTVLATVLQLLYKRGMLNLGTNPSQAEGAADSSNAHAPPSGLSIQASSASTAARQLESQSIDVAVDDVGVGSKRKLKSPVWDEFKRVKTGDDCFFKECPHPDDKQRKELEPGAGAGAPPGQVLVPEQAHANEGDDLD